jgi:zinc/manganese transport system substrate-binding protein
VLAAAAGCGSGGDSAAADDGIRVVASTDVYGDLAGVIGGPDVEVTSVLSDPSADPHSYEASARTRLAVSEADLVVQNGGGYDDFMTDLLSADDSGAPVITAVDVSGLDADDEGFNEHVWYDVPTVQSVAGEIVAALSDIDPGRADTYAANGAQLDAGLQELIAAQQSARSVTEGAGVVVTEPVPGYLLDALGARDATPAAFSAAVEEGSDVPPAALRETLDLLAGGDIRALVHNAQTTGPETGQVLAAAEDNGVPVVPVTETLPEGQSYLSWMQGNLDSVVAALSA